MNNTNFKYKLYVGVTLILAILSAVIRTVLLIFHFDRGIGYYSHGTSIPTLHTVILCAALAFAASLFLATKKDEIKEKKFRVSGIFIFSSALCAFSLVGGFILTLVRTGTSSLDSIAAFIGVPAALYFLSILINTPEAPKLRSLFGFFVPIWATLNLAAIYFDSYVAINAPNKIIEQMAFISIMLFFLYELRVHLDKQKPRFHLFFGLCALIFTATAAFPGIIAVSFGSIDADYIMYDVIFAAMFIYILCSLLSRKEDGGE